MKSVKTYIRLILMAVLLLGGASTGTVVAAGAPQFSSLGQIRDAFVSPTRIAVDGAGSLYVVDAREKAVFKFDKYGVRARGISAYGAVPASGGGLAVVGSGELLLVAEQTSVGVIDGATGALLGYLGGKDRFSYVYDIAIDAKGYVFVADGDRLTVDVFRPQAGGAVPYQFDYRFGSKGIAPGQSMGLAAMDINVAAGEVYIADPVTHKPEGATTPVSYPKVQVYDLAGNLKKTTGGLADFILLGSNSFGTKAMAFFGGIAFDGQGRGYFTDSYNGRINVLNLQGPDPLKMYLSSYIATGYTVGKLLDPRDAAFDPVTGRLFVLCGDGRVEIFGIDGATNPVKVNKAPLAPELCSPIGGSEAVVASPTLTWLEADDPDGDDLEYRVQVGLSGKAPTTHTGIAATAFVLPSALEENQLYAWTAQAFDGEAASEWADAQTFYVNAREEAPSAPVAVAPAAAMVVDGAAVFSWQPASDPDPFETLSYVLQVAGDAAFSTVVFEEFLDGTSVALGDCTGYPALEDGKGYYWRVKAVDSTGLESAPSAAVPFTFDTTVLKVTANVAGAKVYLGGNLGYAGQLVGEAPVELRDFPVGLCSVVLEMAGYEPFVVQANVVERQGATVNAVLVPFAAPEALKVQGHIAADDMKIRVGADAAPYFVDFNNDGGTDLLVGNAAGHVELFLGVPGEVYAFTMAGPLALPSLIPGAVPVVADWNGDLRKDLLVGAADGTLTLLLNAGSEAAPVFADSALLTVGGGVLDVGSKAAPAVIDLDNDGLKDLVVGSSDGTLAYYRNVGEDAAPVLEYAGKLVEMPEAADMVPFLVDWDGNGSRDLMVSANGQLYLFPRLEDGSFAAGQALQVERLLAEEVAHFFACDVDGAKGKDILVGTTAGEIVRAMSQGKTTGRPRR